MKVKILNRDHFSTKDDKKLAMLEAATDVRLTLPRKKLVIEYNGSELAKYETDHYLSFEQFEDRIICFLRDEKSRRISFELYGPLDKLIEARKIIVKRNHALSYKSPLLRDFSIKTQDSMLSDKNRQLNISGFINLAFLFVCLNYVRLIIESKPDEKFAFLENVR